MSNARDLKGLEHIISLTELKQIEIDALEKKLEAVRLEKRKHQRAEYGISAEENERIEELHARYQKPIRGYYWNADHNRWQAQFRLNGEMKYLGSFRTEEEAREAYERAFKEFFSLSGEVEHKPLSNLPKKSKRHTDANGPGSPYSNMADKSKPQNLAASSDALASPPPPRSHDGYRISIKSVSEDQMKPPKHAISTLEPTATLHPEHNRQITVKECRELMTSMVPDAILAIHKIILDKKTCKREQISAARLIFEYAIPKPTEAQTADSDALNRLADILSEPKGQTLDGELGQEED